MIKIIIGLFCLCVIVVIIFNVVKKKNKKIEHIRKNVKSVVTYEVKGMVVSKNIQVVINNNWHILLGATEDEVSKYNEVRYVVAIEYEDITLNFFDEKLYKSCEIDEKIPIFLHEVYNKKGKKIYRTIDLSRKIEYV